MRDETVSRSYAETLFDLARRHEGLEAFGEGIDVVAQLLDENPRFRLFLETPRVPDEDRKAVVRNAFGDRLPRQLLHFLFITIDKRRQRLLREIAREFHLLVDGHLGREHVEVTLARSPDDASRSRITERLSALLGKQAVPHFQVEPDILGGIVVRTEDTIYDGSVRRRLDGMRRQLLAAPLGSGGAA